MLSLKKEVALFAGLVEFVIFCELL